MHALIITILANFSYVYTFRQIDCFFILQTKTSIFKIVNIDNDFMKNNDNINELVLVRFLFWKFSFVQI
jgi:hypothetical protein